jgi:hypothetical protein
MYNEDLLIISMFWNYMRLGVGISAGLNHNQLSNNDILTKIGWGDPNYPEPGWLFRFARGVAARQFLYNGFFGDYRI